MFDEYDSNSDLFLSDLSLFPERITERFSIITLRRTIIILQLQILGKVKN